MNYRLMKQFIPGIKIMNKYNPEIHNRRSIRLKGYDYSQSGLYFITMCCHKRACLFGEIVVNPKNHLPKMVLNAAGKIANKCWMEIPKHFPNVILHEYVIMPNHVHGIIEITQNVGARFVDDNESVGAKTVDDNESVGTKTVDDNEPVGAKTVGAKNFSPLPRQRSPENEQPDIINRANIDSNKNEQHGIFNRANIDSPLQPPRSPSKTIGSIVRGFKIGVTKWMRNNTDVHDVWQRNYYDHIIRNEQSYHNITEYIKNNPVKWADDKFFVK